MATAPLFVVGVGQLVPCRHWPGHSSVILWAQKDRQAMLKLQEELSSFSNVLKNSPEPTIEEVEQAGMFCTYVEGTWLRVKADGPIFSASADQFEVLCIDYGYKQLVPSLGFMRLFPAGTEQIQHHPAMVSKFLLADVFIEKQFQYKNYVKIYLETHIINQPVNAIFLGRVEDYEVVRLFTKCGRLLAKSLMEKNLVVQTETYKMAIQNLPGGVHSMTPEGQSPTTSPSLSPISDSTQFTAPAVKFYTSSSIHLNTSLFVTVISIQKGVNGFTILKQMDEAERRKIQSQLNMEKGKLNPLSNPIRGMACAILSERDGILYRGLILGSKKTIGTFSVYLVDFGIAELYQPSMLFEIPSEFMGKSLFAIRASLVGSEMFDLFDTKRVNEAFDQLVKGKTFTARVSDESTSSPPQKLHLSDTDGREVKDLLLELLKSRPTPSIQLTVNSEPQSLPPVPVKPSLRANLKIPAALVLSEEKLFVTSCRPVGSFFGQFLRRPIEEMDEMDAELYKVYSNLEDLSLLYDDDEDHIGDFAVIKWEDKQLYRAQIIEEPSNETSLVRLVDHGNLTEVRRRDIWAPVSTLKLFSQEPFGICCQLSQGHHLTVEEWENTLLNKPVEVKVVSCVGQLYSVTLPEVIINTHMIAALKPLACPKIPSAVVEREENLFVTYSESNSEFFGQFARRSVEDLCAIESELASVYDSLLLKPLLYADCKEHSGDNGVIRWLEDGRLYRVEVVQELLDNSILVMLVDYGNIFPVSPDDIWAPVPDLKLFSQPPFGINCRINHGSDLKSETRGKAFVDKSVQVELNSLTPQGRYYTVTLPDCAANAEIYSALRG